jgi:hypothetical protein
VGELSARLTSPHLDNADNGDWQLPTACREIIMWSFAPPGLGGSPFLTHGLRRGLHSDAASRLLIF